MRFMASQPPGMTPNLSTDVIAYAEQVGVKRHDGPTRGEMMIWYPRISATAARRAILMSERHRPVIVGPGRLGRARP